MLLALSSSHDMRRCTCVSSEYENFVVDIDCSIGDPARPKAAFALNTQNSVYVIAWSQTLCLVLSVQHWFLTKVGLDPLGSRQNLC